MLLSLMKRPGKKYISEALESFLMQITDFDYEIIVVDDNSPDSTFQICLEYQKKHANRIKLFKNEVNLGPIPNLTKALNLCTGKYIAWCEGDDYWTNPFKLQKQVDFLEANPDFSLSFHNSLIKWEDGSLPDSLFCPPNQKEVSTIKDVIKGWFIPSASMVFRRDSIMPLPDWFPGIYNGDWGIQLLLGSKGNIWYISEVMSVYRKALGSLSYSLGKNVEFVFVQKKELLLHINQLTNYKFQASIEKAIKTLNKDLKDFLLKRKSKYIYWLFHPKRLIKKILIKYFKFNKLKLFLI